MSGSGTCAACGRRYVGNKEAVDAGCCGTVECRALATWSAAEWEGRARMAEAAAAAGLPANRLDREARRRAGGAR